MDRARREPYREPEFPDQYKGGRGESYRPGGARERSPNRDLYRTRSPPRRPDFGDSYRAPRGRSRSPPPRRDDFRRRSPSPPRYRDSPREVRGGDRYTGRARSPPRREDLPRDDLFRREPPRPFRDERLYRDDRAFSDRSPLPRFNRERSPPGFKRRDPSPIASRGRRTPPPVARPYDGYVASRGPSPVRPRYSDEPRSRRPSPPRAATNDYTRSPLPRTDVHSSDNWRRSPQRFREDVEMTDDVPTRDNWNSHPSSRRSSPPPASRYPQIDRMDDRQGRPSPITRSPYEARESFAPHPLVATRPSPPKPEPMETVPIVSSRPPPSESPAARAPPAGPAGYRPPPMSMAPPTGPGAATAPIAPIAPTAPTAPLQLRTGAPPSGPRAQAQVATLPSTPRGRGGFGGEFAIRGGRAGFGGTFRGGRGGVTPGFGRGENFQQREADLSGAAPSGPSTVPPTGPRGQTIPSGPRAGFQPLQRFPSGGNGVPDGPGGPPTGPRAQRRPTEPGFDHRFAGPHPALADIPRIMPGGQKAEPLQDTSRLNRLEDDAEKLRKMIEEREAKKKKNLHEWDRLTRETEVASLRSELAEQSMRKLNGEAETQAAF